jgi:hypothetical protein
MQWPHSKYRPQSFIWGLCGGNEVSPGSLSTRFKQAGRGGEEGALLNMIRENRTFHLAIPTEPPNHIILCIQSLEIIQMRSIKAREDRKYKDKIVIQITEIQLNVIYCRKCYT